MKLVGLTGGIGSGKSQVSRMLRELGAAIIDADELAHKSQVRGQEAWAAIFERFGWPVLRADGSLDRKKLGYRVFNQPHERDRLNAIVHPIVRRMMGEAIAAYRERGEAVTVLDVPLLIEGGLNQMVDEVWVVYARPDQQIARIVQRDRVGVQAARKRIQAQMPLADKLALADRVIDNTGTLDALREQVNALWRDITGEA